MPRSDRTADDDGRMDSMPPEALLAGYPAPMRAIAQRLREIVRRALPDAIEAVRPGWRLIGYDIPSGRKTAFCCFVWAEQEHVHLGFQYGVFMHDPDRALDGEGITQRARWLTFEPGDPLDEAALRVLLHEAARVTRLSRAERFAALLDRPDPIASGG
jgi:hypothetical protein